MKTKYVVYIMVLILCYLLNITILFAQQNVTQTKDDPVELATIVIQGTEAVDIPGGTKQGPKKTPQLSRERLDSLNTLEKHSAIRLPALALPFHSLARPIAKGYVKGEFGQYLTPLIDAGYGFALGGYRLEANGGIEASNGHLANADYFNAHAALDAEYIAPEKFIFFGGSKTRTFMRFDRYSHELFALQNPLQRTRTHFLLGVQTNGAYNGYTYNIGGDWGSSALDQSNDAAANNQLHGFIGATKKMGDFVVGADANVRFHTLRGSGLHLIDVLGTGEYTVDQFLLKGSAGLQSYTNADGTTFGAFAMRAKTDYSLNSSLTIGGFLRSGLVENSFIEVLKLNPYTSGTTVIEYPRENIVVGGQLWYHPLEKISAMVQASFGSIGNFALWSSTGNGTFGIRYADVTSIQMQAELSYSLDENNLITGNLQARSVRTADENTLPYIAPVQSSLRWDRVWSDKVNTQVTATYIGVRSTGTTVLKQLPGYVDISLRSSYSLTNTLQFYARLDNLINANVMVWEGYKERGIFFAAGVVWSF